MKKCSCNISCAFIKLETTRNEKYSEISLQNEVNVLTLLYKIISKTANYTHFCFFSLNKVG